MAGHELTRRAMYDLVWSRPMSSVAQDFGISDVSLKNICDKHGVPTPGRGYWARKKAGKPAPPAHFRPISDARLERIVITGPQVSLPERVRQVLAAERERRKARVPPEIPPPPAPEGPVQNVHPVLAATAKALRRGKPAEHGAVSARDEGQCGVSVGQTQVERAIALLDRLARDLGARGFSLEAAGKGLRVSEGPDSLLLSLREETHRQKHEPTLEELAAEERRQKQLGLRSGWEFSWQRAYPEFDTIRTGLLILEIDNHYVGLRRTWKDGKTQRIEGLIESAVSGVVAYLAAIKVQREKNEQWKREWDHKQRLAALAELRREREKKRRKFVERYLDSMKELRHLRAFQDALKALSASDDAGEFSRLCAWVDEQIAVLHGSLTVDGIKRDLQAAELFPEIDPLFISSGS